jgi:hypothetical protein
MIAAYKDMFDADLIHATGEVGETAIIQTQTGVPVVAGAESEGLAVDEQGMMPTAALTMIVRTAALTITPELGGLVTYKSRNYRIVDIQRHQGDKALSLILTKDSGRA